MARWFRPRFARRHLAVGKDFEVGGSVETLDYHRGSGRGFGSSVVRGGSLVLRDGLARSWFFRGGPLPSFLVVKYYSPFLFPYRLAWNLILPF